MKLVFYIFIFVLALSVSCTKKANIKLPESESKVVVTCFITPDDSLISAVVRMSKPKFAPPDSSSVFLDDVSNAKVTLSDGGASVNIPFDENVHFYRIPAERFPIQSGKTYQLEVSLPDGKRITASTTVPFEKPEIESIETPVRKSDSTSFEQDITIIVPDVPGKTNYVMFHFQNLIIKSGPPDPNFPFIPGMHSWFAFDTDEKTAKTKYYHHSMNNYFGSDTIRYAQLDITVLNCSREFYLYNKSVQDAGFGGNPFGDPVMVYSNITNGFGCFGAYRSKHTFSRIK